MTKCIVVVFYIFITANNNFFSILITDPINVYYVIRKLTLSKLNDRNAYKVFIYFLCKLNIKLVRKTVK